MDICFNELRIAVLGGDRRQTVISKDFAKAGCGVRAYALSNLSETSSKVEICMTLEKAAEGADVYILPLPVTRDNLHLNAQGEKIKLCDIVKLAAKNKAIIFGGLIPDEMKGLCERIGVEAIDYYDSESLQRKNALPSAEGALMIAMEHTDITVSRMRALVSGYGRIGRILASILHKLGASVTVAARRDECLCEASMMGYGAVRISGEGTELKNALENTDVIFNTVPYVIFTEKVLNDIVSTPLYIEIASAPGGIDIAAARGVGIETIFAPSLPGKYAPVSAGEYIFETVSDIILKRRAQ